MFETIEERPDKTIEVTISLRTKISKCKTFNVTGFYRYSEVNPTGTGKLVKEERIRFEGRSDLSFVPKGLQLVEDGCLPDVSRIAFDRYKTGYYNYFGYGGFIRQVRDSEGSLSYIYSTSDSEGHSEHFQYNAKRGQWYLRSEPAYDCLSCDLNTMFEALYDPKAIGHFVLNAGGMVPVFGEGFDAVNGIWYAIDGDTVNATISFASTLPLVYLTTAKYIGKIVRLADGSYALIKFGGASTQEFLEKVRVLDLDEATLARLNADLNDKAFAEAIIRNPELVNVWRKMLDAGDNIPDALRRNTGALEAQQSKGL